jgi:hypothetical protein
MIKIIKKGDNIIGLWMKLNGVYMYKTFMIYDLLKGEVIVSNNNKSIFWINEYYRLDSGDNVSHSSIMEKLLTGRYSVDIL